MMRHKKTEANASNHKIKGTQTSPSELEPEHAGRSGMLVPTAIRCAMGGDQPNHYTLTRSYTSLEQDDLAVIVKKRGGEPFKRNSGNRPESMVEITESKRKSDPCSSSTFLSSVTSLKAMFGVNTDKGESLMFKRLGTKTAKKTAADTRTRNVTPGLKRLPHERASTGNTSTSKAPSPSTSKKSSTTSKNASTSGAPKKADTSAISTNDVNSSKTSKSRREKAPRKRFFSSSSKRTSKDSEDICSSDEEKRTMDNLPSISEGRETLHDGLSSSDETLDPDSTEENHSDSTEIRSESPLHYVDCEDTRQCENCRKGSHHSRIGDEDCTSINSSCLGDEQPTHVEDMAEGHKGMLVDHYVTIRRDPNLRGQSFRKDKRLSMIMAAGLDPGKPPAATSRSLEHLAVDGGVEKKWTRSTSLRRHFHSSRHNGSHQQDPSAHSDTEIGKISAPHSLLDGECGSVGGSVSSERAIDVGRVGAWATSFEKLLEDPAGLHTFAEFLKKEYSHENIYFWTACERYKRVSNPDELRAMAKEIFERHLYSGAPEPVNVDSQARQDAEEGLHTPNQFLFDQAQKQIFNLMKFDSYSRFLKSSLYQDCVSRDMRGQTLPYPGDDNLDPDLRIAQEDSHVKLKKSRSDAEERRRKSLLPWNRKDRSKSKDRGEAEYRRRKKQNQRNTSDSSSIRSDISGSRTSLNSSDLPLGRRALSKESLTSGELGSLSGSEGYSRCRVILPDLSNSVVAVRNDESVQALLTRLLERRGLSYSTFDVYQHKTDKLLDKNEDSSILGGMEVRLEQRIIFRLDLPNRKTVCVKAKPNKVTNDVLKPILLKYGYKLDLMYVHKVGEEKGVNLKSHVNELDGDRLMVQTKEEVKEWGLEQGRQKKRGSTLDEITNRVFEDLLKGKSEQNFDELGILDFDARSSRTDNSSDKSSGILGGFSRRNSLAPDKETGNKPRKQSNRSSVHENLGVRGMLTHGDHVLVTKRRGNNPANVKQENDELYEGLKRAQRSRLDDQRGTEINFELPDFLKCDQPQDKENQHAHLADQLLAHLECSFSDGVVIPTHQEAEDYFSMAHPEVWGGIPSSTGPLSANATLLAPDLDLDDFDETLRGDESLCQIPLPDTSSSTLHVDPPDFSPPPPILMENSAVPAVSRMALTALPLSPPPLPPKPKLGGIRGPPPRPPSRQLHLLNPPMFTSTSDDDTLHSSDPPIHITRQSHDKFNISFV